MNQLLILIVTLLTTLAMSPTVYAKCGWHHDRGFPEYYGPCGGVIKDLNEIFSDPQCQKEMANLWGANVLCGAAFAAAVKSGGHYGSVLVLHVLK